MKRMILLSIMLLSLAGMFAMANWISTNLAVSKPIPKSFRAVYLVQRQGELSPADLQAHPEVLVTNTFEGFTQHADKRVALWIDKNAVNLIRGQPQERGRTPWLDQAPQANYPLVLVGYNDWLYSFRENLTLCCFLGPIIDWRTKKLEPGFSVIQRKATSTGLSDILFLKGYNQMPKVQAILHNTNALLDGKIKPTPTATLSFPMPATPSPLVAPTRVP